MTFRAIRHRITTRCSVIQLYDDAGCRRSAHLFPRDVIRHDTFVGYSSMFSRSVQSHETRVSTIESRSLLRRNLFHQTGQDFKRLLMFANHYRKSIVHVSDVLGAGVWWGAVAIHCGARSTLGPGRPSFALTYAWPASNVVHVAPFCAWWIKTEGFYVIRDISTA